MKSRSICRYFFPVLFIFLGVVAFSACDEDSGRFKKEMTRTFSVDEGGTLYMDVSQGRIEIRTDPGNQVNVQVIRYARTYDKRRAEEAFRDNPIEFRQTGPDVWIEMEKPRGRLFGVFERGKVGQRFVVTVPESYNLDLRTSGGGIEVGDIEGKVRARTSGGSLKFGRIKGELQGATSGGRIVLASCTNEVDLRTSGGSISAGRLDKEARLSTSGGRIEVTEARKAVQANTSGGSISVGFYESPSSDCRLTTSGGGIDVSLPEGAKFVVDARTSGGRVHIDFPVTMSGSLSSTRLDAEVNGGGPLLYLRTSGGSIRILQKEAGPELKK